jgi:hypothetical protein
MKKPAPKPSRAVKRQIAGWFEPEVSRALRILAAEHDTSVQALMAEALDLLFVRYGKPRIAVQTRRKRPKS